MQETTHVRSPQRSPEVNETIFDPADIGSLVREKRKRDKLTQAETSALCNVGTRFLSELENGKPTLELGKVLQVLSCLGLEVSISQRRWSKREQ
jgi:y4mF family transcriptional regulator